MKNFRADNGREFAYHEKISQELETEFYFSHPYFSWERGLNENTNGLIGQYLKKGSDVSHITEIDYYSNSYMILADKNKSGHAISGPKIKRLSLVRLLRIISVCTVADCHQNY